RAVDQPRNQRLLFGGPALALEITARDAPRGIEFFLVIDRQRKEIDAFLRLFRGNDGGENFGLAVGRKDGAVGLSGYLSGFQGELAPTPVEFNAVDIKHLNRLSWFSRKGESHEQDGERLCRARELRAVTAPGDPAMAFMTSSVITGVSGPLLVDSRIAVRRTRRQYKNSAGKRADAPRGTVISGGCRACR